MTFFFHCKQENRPPTRQTGETMIPSTISILTPVLGAQKNHLNEVIPPEHPQHVFNHKY